MRILCCPADRQGCGRWRMGVPIAALAKLEPGLEIKLAEGVPVKWDRRTGEPVGFAAEFGRWDALIVQRPMTRTQVVALLDAQRRGIRVVVELDDDYRALHPLSPAHVGTHPNMSAERNRSWLAKACQSADLLIVTTPALARRYGAHGRCRVVQNYVPESWLRIKAARRGNVVGWTGTVASHHGDLAMTRGGVARAVRDAKAMFRVIGRPELVREGLGLDDEPELVNWLAFDSYPREVARLDVGIAPLGDSQFNNSKSWLKPLEMAACGVPCVASPRPSYVELHSRGIGVLAKDRERDWRREVTSLLTNEARRSEVAEAGRAAASELTIEKNAWRFAEAWTGEGESGRRAA